MSWQVRGYVHRLELGGGMTGRVVLAAAESTGELVVIKYLRIEEEYFEQVRDEMHRLSTLDATYFVRIREYVEEAEGTAIIMDPVNGASLRMLLRDHGALSSEASLLVFRDSLAGLVGAHAADVVHGDYRPENLIVDTSGASLMLDVRMATWVRRDVTLGTGVYLAPERWRGEACSATADVYAATVTFVEMLAGEPPYWEESQLLALRYMHEQDAIPVEGIPVALREIARQGLAKSTDTRADAVALLGMLEMVAVAEYGAGWDLTGRRHLTERVALLSLPFGGATETDRDAFVAGGELDEMDDYYLEGAVAGAAAVEVVAAAVEIVELAELEEMAVAEALAVAAAEVEVLTVEEELAVAEVEQIVAVSEVEAGDDVAIGVVAVAGTAIAAGAAEIAAYEEFDEIVVAGAAVPPPVTRPAVPVGAGVGAGGASAAGAGAAAGAGLAAAGGVAIGYAAEEETTSFIRRHPWISGFFALILVVACAGAALAATGGLAGGPPSSTPVAAISTPSDTSGAGVPGYPSGSSSSSPAGTTSPSGSPIPSPSCSTTPSTSPTPSPTHSPKPSHSPSTHPTTTPPTSPSHSPSPSPTNPYFDGATGPGVAGVPPVAGAHERASPPGPC